MRAVEQPARPARGRRLLPAAGGQGHARARRARRRQRRSSSSACAPTALERERVARADRRSALAVARAAAGAGGGGRARAATGHCAYTGRLRIPDDLPMRALSGRLRERAQRGDGRLERAAHRRAGAGGRTPRGLAAARGGRGQRQDLGARRALRAGRARGRRRARRGSSRSRSPSAPRASCASASARACWSSASARRRARPRRRSWAPSTASARGCCAPTRCRPGVEPGFTILEEGFAGRLRALAFSERARGLPRRRARARRSIWSRPMAPTAARDGARRLCAAAQPGASARRGCPASAGRRRRSTARGERRVRAARRADRALRRPPTRERKHVRAALDFDDLELLRPRLLEQRADVRERWSRALRAADGRRVPGLQPAPARRFWRRSTATTCSRSATSCSRSTASVTPM